MADRCDAKAYFECLGEDLAHVLLAEVAGRAEALLHLSFFAVPFGRTTASTRADGAAEHFWSPPSVDSTFGVVEAEDRIGVGEGPGVRGLGETRDYVQGSEGEGGARGSGLGGRRSGGVRRDDAGAGRGGNRFHTATVLDAQNATGFI